MHASSLCSRFKYVIVNLGSTIRCTAHAEKRSKQHNYVSVYLLFINMLLYDLFACTQDKYFSSYINTNTVLSHTLCVINIAYEKCWKRPLLYRNKNYECPTVEMTPTHWESEEKIWCVQSLYNEIAWCHLSHVYLFPGIQLVFYVELFKFSSNLAFTL